MLRISPHWWMTGVGALAWTLASTQVEAQVWRTMTSARQVWDRTPLEVDIEYGAGTLEIEPADAPTLYRMELRYDEERFEPRAEFDAEGRQLRLGIRSTEGGGHFGRRGGSRAEIALTREVPLDLSLEFGAGRADIELGGVSIQRLSIQTGASETDIAFSAVNPIEAERISIEAGAAELRVEGLGNARAREISFEGGVGSTVLDFGGTWDHDATASVHMGVGSLTLRIPRGQGVRIERDSFLTSFDAPELRREGNSYISGNWATAAHKLTIEISAALGSIDIEWID